MTDVQPGMLMLLSGCRNTVGPASYLMETVKSSSPRPNSLSLQCVFTQGASYHPITGSRMLRMAKYYRWRQGGKLAQCGTKKKAHFHTRRIMHHVPDLIGHKCPTACTRIPFHSRKLEHFMSFRRSSYVLENPFAANARAAAPYSNLTSVRWEFISAKAATSISSGPTFLPSVMRTSQTTSAKLWGV